MDIEGAVHEEIVISRICEGAEVRRSPKVKAKVRQTLLDLSRRERVGWKDDEDIYWPLHDVDLPRSRGSGNGWKLHHIPKVEIEGAVGLILENQSTTPEWSLMREVATVFGMGIGNEFKERFEDVTNGMVERGVLTRSDEDYSLP